LWFGYSGHVLWQLGLLMAVFNILGSVVGIRLAVRYGSGFIRQIFLLVVSALILKTAYDGFFRG
ncbi:MAG: sulfite exporter TauE/SafE family protein, partial [Herbaspirillum sp.]